MAPRRRLTVLFVCLIGAIHSSGHAEKKIVASDLAVDDFFGHAVSLDGDTVVVGASGDDEGSGAAYVFSRNQGGPNNWGQVRKLVALDRGVYDHVGTAISLDGDTVVVGASGDGEGSGAAYVFSRNQGGPDNWGQVRKLIASDHGVRAHFGTAVSLDGDTVVVGASGDGEGSGAAYVFSRNQGGPNNWGQVQKLTALDPEVYAHFGTAVSLDGDTVVVGASGDGEGSGAAHIFFFPRAIFADPQTLTATADPGERWRPYFYNYSTAQSVWGAETLGSATFDVSMPYDNWTGVFLYSLDTGQWEEALWLFKSDW